MRFTQAGFGHQHVSGFGFERQQGGGLRVQRGQQPDVAQEPQLESAQRHRQGVDVLAGQQLDGDSVGVKQRRVRVVTGQQAHEQFVEVIAREQRVPRGHDVAALPFGALEVADFSVTAKGHMQALQRQQHRAKVGTGFFGAPRHQRDATVAAREHLQNQARLAPVVAVQHIGWFVRKSFRRHRLHQAKRHESFPAGPPQGKMRPFGGQRTTRSGERGGHITHSRRS